MYVKLRDRQFKETTSVFVPADLYVSSYSWRTDGGPDEATISGRGNADDLLQMLMLLRYDVTIYDSRTKPVWWGYIHEIEVRVGAVAFKVSCHTLANHVRVTYTQPSDGTTDWADDATSIAMYGKKEQTEAAQNADINVANNLRDAILLAQSNPYLKPEIQFSKGGSFSATLTCRGYELTLDWLPYQHDVVSMVAYQTRPINLAFGTTTQQMIAQSFQVPAGQNTVARAAMTYLTSVGVCTDSVQCDIYTNDGGIPGESIASGQIDGSTVPASDNWPAIWFDTPVELAPNTWYFLVWKRTGQTDDTNYYQVGWDNAAGYSGGNGLYFDGTNWIDPPGDMYFVVYGNQKMQTTDIIKDIITQDGQFFTGYDITNASGIYTDPYRDGFSNGRSNLRELLDGGTTNQKRLVATITQDRRYVVREEPPDDDIEVFIDMNGDLWDKFRNPIPKSDCPAACWAQFINMPTTALQIVGLQDMGVFFIERCSYNVNDDELSFEPRGVPSTADLLQILVNNPSSPLNPGILGKTLRPYL